MLSQACQRCWQRKQKCDRQAPECSTCVASGHKCVPRVWGRLQESAAAEILDSRNVKSSIEYMKRRIEYVENKQSSSDYATATSPTDHEPRSHASFPDRTSTSVSSLNIGKSSGVFNVAVDEVEYLSLAAMSGGGINDQTQWQNSTLEHLVQSVITTTGINPDLVTTIATPNTAFDLLNISSFDQVRNEVEVACHIDFPKLIRIFAQNTASSLPFLSEEKCLATVNSAVSSEVDANTVILNPSGTTASASCILALGATMSPFRSKLAAPISKLIDKSRLELGTILTISSDNVAVHCLILQCMLSLYYPSAGSTWHLLGLAINRAICAGYHRVSTGVKSDETQFENTFWSLYLLDRMLAYSMGRPCGLEDDDIGLLLPEMPTQHSFVNFTNALTALFTLKLHQAFLLSQWRYLGKFEVETAIQSFEHWKDSYREILGQIPHLTLTQSQVDDDSAFLQILNRKDEAQLSCRALIHLLVHAMKRLSPQQDSLLRVKQLIIAEMPPLVEIIYNSLDEYDVANSFLDGYDAFGAAIVFVISNYNVSQPSVFRLTMSQMKTVTICTDVLQQVSQQFKPMRGLKDIIWALLGTLEAKTESRSSDQLARKISECEVSVPKHIRKLLEICT